MPYSCMVRHEAFVGWARLVRAVQGVSSGSAPSQSRKPSVSMCEAYFKVHGAHM